MTLVLAGDVGGTKTMLQLVEVDSTGTSISTVYNGLYPSRDFFELVPMLQKFLASAAEELGKKPTIEKACFGVAGPVADNNSYLPNLGWSLQAHRIEAELDINKVSLINDFAAVGYGVTGLGVNDLHTLQANQPQEGTPIAVIGAGTGLGQGFLLRQGEDIQVFASEGGHTDFAPRNELEFQLLKYLLDKHNIDRVSVERVVSGQGIVSIYQFLRDLEFAHESPEIGQIMRTWESEAGKSEKTVDPAATIAKAALEKRDRLCEKTMQIFVEAYGAEAGNLALKLLPYGGLYIAGGIAAKILPLITEGSFMRTFTDKGRLSSLLKKVPVHIVLNPQVGLIGAAIRAARL